MGCGGIILALIAGVAPATAAAFPVAIRASVRIVLSPSSGGPRTAFVLRFRNPARTGTVSGIRRVDRVLVSGPHVAGCVSSLTVRLAPAAAGARVRSVLRPRGRRRWCSGRFHGRLVASQSITCTPGPARACPLLVNAPRTLARFSFWVGLSGPGGGGGTGGGPGPGGGSGTGTDIPTFAGLQSATTCSGAPLLHSPPSGRTYTLSWAAAAEPVTPSSGIVYEIFFAATPAGENFSSPTWTTAPGATAYSGNLTTAGSAYFVVRARNQAGHQDANTVEKLAVNSC
ncbi:MAG: hypothetical protein NVS3B18_11450 [Candidatus Dormibacteria bacterium]